MQKTRGGLATKVCEKLPFGQTIYETRGECTKPNTNCKYCREQPNQICLCYKKTNTSITDLVLT